MLDARSAALVQSFLSNVEYQDSLISPTFGNESFDRRDLPAIAAQRINEHLGAQLQPEQFIVIGDTPNDVACARHFGARVLAVATGRVHSAEDLAACKPDALLPDLLDVELVIGTLGGL